MSTTHVHLLLNHFPTVGFVMAIGLFVAAVVARSDLLKQVESRGVRRHRADRDSRRMSRATPPPESCAWRRQNEPCADPAISRPLIERHEGAAVLCSLAMMLVTGRLRLAWLVAAPAVEALLPRGTLAIVAVLCLLSLGLVARAASIGGEIRHPEVRAGTGACLGGAHTRPQHRALRERRAVDVDFRARRFISSACRCSLASSC